MDDLAAALADAGGIDAPREHAARLRALVAAALADGAAQLALRRSGYGGAPVTVAIAPAAGALLAAVPADPAVRADPDAVDERTWLLVAALTGALADAGGVMPPRAGVFEGALALLAPGAADAELAAIAFEEHVAGIDRLRARAVAVPGAVLETATDLRDPIGATHPLVVAHHVAALGGRPADPASVETHEDAVLTLVGAARGDDGVARPHDDPDPARRVARRILQRLDGMGKWGGFHTEFAHLARGFAPAERALAADVGEALLAAGLLDEKPSVGQRHVFLNPRRAGDIHRLIDDGELPAGLRLPRP
jgi:hypothetical protein